MQERDNGRVMAGDLAVAGELAALIEGRIAPAANCAPERFWEALRTLVVEFAPENRQLLARRDELQEQIDAYHRQCAGQPHDPEEYQKFLFDIGYLVEEGEPFVVTTDNVDPEIATIAGPQLVVPITNSRYAVNAVNGRWGSLYDALYGTDVLTADPPAHSGYDRERGRQVMACASAFLDTVAPVDSGSHGDMVCYRLVDGETGKTLEMVRADGTVARLAEKEKFAGYCQGDDGELSAILLCNHGLHLELQIDRDHPIGRDHPAGIKDVVMEAALTTICDCEDSVAAVDGSDKALSYGNWFGLITGELQAVFSRKGKTITRTLNADRTYTAPDGTLLSLCGRSLMLIRNVGHLMTTDAVLHQGAEIPEGILDTLVTGLVARVELEGTVRFGNSRSGSVYIVKPKMHGPEEVAFACRLFNRTEELLGLPPRTLKIGIMDEERRTSVNLKECIRAARDRIIFINTGFLDRTGDEIHTSMLAGPMMMREQMKNSSWIGAYEARNVAIGLAAGFSGRAQIGKGMWPKPDRMAEMVATKIDHLRAGANCAWVPSPTAATLHAMHYHQVDVFAVHRQLVEQPVAPLAALLALPVAASPPTGALLVRELENSVQSILGYVVRWIDQGIGCSKVPDIDNVGLMEDRATLRISSQYLANWLHHGVCSREQVEEVFHRMAVVVDRQNSGDPAYRPMSADFASSLAFQAARELVLSGREQPNGYTEPILHRYRRRVKQRE